MKTIIGQAASGEDFFPRPQITEEIWTKLEAGNNLLLVAPRRVGKSSILFNLRDNPRANFITIYYDSEAVNDENEFYKKLFNIVNDNIGGIKNTKTLQKTLLRIYSQESKVLVLKMLVLNLGKVNYRS